MSSRTRSRRLLRGVVGGAVAAVVLGLATSVSGPQSASAQETPVLSVDATPTTGVVDGDAIDVRVAAGPGAPNIISGSRARICRDGVDYLTPADLLPYGKGDCPNVGVSSSATPGGAAGVNPLPGGRSALGTLRVGTGRVQWGPAEDATAFELTCDVAHPCRLVVEIVTVQGTVIDDSIQVTFADASALGACGGSDPAALTSAGPDRFIDTWARWTRDQCERGGGKASTTAVLTGEGLGLDSFAGGAADLAYSGIGTAMPSRELPAPRGAVAVPVALNAAVIGVLGGYYSPEPDWPTLIPRPFTDLSLTVAELAALFGQGRFGFNPSMGDPVMDRNPQLAAVSPLNDPAMAPSGSDVTSYLLTSWFDARASSAWVTPRVEIEGIAALSPRGPEDELSAADPGFPITILNLYSARANLKQAVASASLVSAGSFPIRWVLTDLATATQLGIPTIAVQNSRGEMIRPTPESLALAAEAMEVADDGSITAAGDGEAPGAYPLTFVEQIVAPTEPLLDADCAPREDSQAVLASWIDYVTGPGQDELDGLVPLTAELQAQAATAKTSVGTAEVTGDCAPTPPPTPPAAAPPDAPPGAPPSAFDGAPPPANVPTAPGAGPGSLGPGSGGASGGPVAGSGAGPGGGAPAAEEAVEENATDAEDSAEAAAAGVTLPDLLGVRALRGAGGVLVVLAVALMSALAGPISTGRKATPGL